jgi:hydroxymethylpyrimidine/phosphomethylpyrimidine kinase
MHTALTIAGSDSGGGAGIQADLKTFAAHGVFGMTAITAITAQNTMGVTAVHPLPADLVTAQIEAVTADFDVQAVKTGMLASAAIVEAVAAAIASLDLPRVVVDPVMVAKSGDRLLEEEAVVALRTELIPRALVITPNVPEAEALADMVIHDVKEARRAARRLRELGPQAVVIKGGHLEGDQAIDVFWDGNELVELTGPRLATTSTHGTGCTFASAIAANLSLGAAPLQAVERAKAYLTEAIRHAPAIGHGHGPLNHFWRFEMPAAPGRDTPARLY